MYGSNLSTNQTILANFAILRSYLNPFGANLS